ncbi:uncharacterized protein LOC119829518 [Zerene cesonia]|uniref:uncharacterized protein LOC119829518 n=1 Tax=Zerene cesonia TaxID=33412 RepID=UPI0018E501C2|nr:uncharacterized protein LOC119829518 [Zerene cesonia]XP_038207997.1 uncharacterized protein LOC119829518 [Zerene cesonia]
MDEYQELEDLEGHVWDIIDDLLHEVAKICKSESVTLLENGTVSRSNSYISISSNKPSLSSGIQDEGSIHDEITHQLNEILSIDEPDLEEPLTYENQSDRIKLITEMTVSILSDVIDQTVASDLEDQISLENFTISLIDTIIEKILSKTLYNNDNKIYTVNESLYNAESVGNITNMSVKSETYEELNDIKAETNDASTMEHIIMEALPTDLRKTESKSDKDVISKEITIENEDINQENISETTDDSFKKVKFSDINIDINSKIMQRFDDR